MGRGWIPLLATALLCGCAPRAQMLVFRPATEEIAGFERLSVLEFDGPQPEAKEAREAVVARFAENRSYTLVEPWVLESRQPVAAASAEFDDAGGLVAAQHAGVDAVLRCQVLGSDVAASGGSVEVAATLTDARTGQVLASRQVRAASGTASAQAVDQCAAELVTMLAPHYEPTEVTLARQWWGEGRSRVAAGNTLARQGDWQKAAEEWETARQANPGNHAALHNLALVAEMRQDYREAFRLLDLAMDQFPAKLYHQTRHAMEARQVKFLAAAKQIESIRAAAVARHSPQR